MKYPEIAKRFNYILTLRQLKARELADKVGMTEAAISHYVNGNRCPTNKTAVRLANVLQCNPLWLMDLDDNMIKDKKNRIEYDFIINQNEFQQKVIEIMNEVKEDSNRQILAYAQALYDMEKRKGGVSNE